MGVVTCDGSVRVNFAGQLLVRYRAVGRDVLEGAPMLQELQRGDLSDVHYYVHDVTQVSSVLPGEGVCGLRQLPEPRGVGL